MNFSNRFALNALTLGVGTALITCGLAGCGLGDSKDVGGDTLQQGQGKSPDGGATTGGGGSATQGAGGASTNPGPGGAGTTGGGTAGATGGGTAGATGGGSAGATGGGIACGKNTCAKGQYCCNALCGVCAPMGAACIQGCPTEPGAPCTTNTDCSAVASYCTGCDCLALGAGDPGPTCTGTPVSCFADACMGKSAVCQNGTCAIKGATPAAVCKVDADCQITADYCTGCDCWAGPKSAAPPKCSGAGVQCLRDPCGGKTAACVGGACVAK
jgi:hypothetical protein